MRFRLFGATNPVYFALHARRRMDLYGATKEDFAMVKVKNSRHAVHNPNARYNKEYGASDIDNSPIVSDPLRLLEICATSDGGAAIVVSSMDYARAHGHSDPVRVAGISLTTPTYPDVVLDLPYMASDSAAVTPAPALTFKESVAQRAYDEAGVGPGDLSLAEVYDLSSALELDWYEQIGLCKQGEAEQLLRSGATVHRWSRAGQRQRRSRCVRRSGARAGHRAGVRAHVAAARASRRATSQRCPGRAVDQPRSLRSRQLRDRHSLGEQGVTIHETVDGNGIAELVMDNPKVNALNIGDTYRLADILDSYKRNLDVRVVILTATGRGLLCRRRHPRDAEPARATKASSVPTTRAGSSSARSTNARFR